jgi:hypothetical protein
MKIYTYMILLILLQSGFAVAQTGIGTKKPDESSVLDIDSKEKGLLIPRMSSEQRGLIKNPANGLIIYNITLNGIDVNIGTKSNPNWVLVGNNVVGKVTATEDIVEATQKLDENQFANQTVLISKDYNILLTDYTILCDNEMHSFTINLPEVSSCQGKVYVINKIDETSNQLNINPPIQLSKKNTVSQLNYPKSFKIQSDGKVWYVIY